MPNIYLLRHGETVWNTEQRLQGQSDSPLTQKGQKQATKNGEKLRSLIQGNEIRVISSPLGRTLDTAKIVACKIGINPESIEVDERLMELSYGDWEGMTKADIQCNDLSRYKKRINDRWNVPAPGGESYHDVARRLDSWLKELKDETIIAVSHGCAGRILRCIHANLEQNNISELSESHEAIFLLTEGGINHL